MQAQKKGRNAQSKKAQKGSCSRGNQEESNGDGNVQCSGNYPSDDDSLEMTACSNVSSASRKSSSGGGATRAGRGAATDPQSLYARVKTNSLNDHESTMVLHIVSLTHLPGIYCLKLNSEVFLLSGDAEKERANQ